MHYPAANDQKTVPHGYDEEQLFGANSHSSSIPFFVITVLSLLVLL